jgi:Na+-driven multidrug efflux pump
MSALAYIFAPWLVGLFRDDADVIEIGTRILRYQCLVFPLSSVIVLTNMMLQSTGKGIWATIVASARQGFFFIPTVIIMSSLFGLKGLEISQTIADICAFLLAFPVALYYMNRFKKGN